MQAIIPTILYRACIILTFASLLTAVGAAQDEKDYMKMFTDHTIGDTVPVFDEYGTGRRGDGYMFVAVDATSCFTCSGSLLAMSEILKGRGLNVEIVAFMGGKSQEYCDVQKKRNGWNFRVAADPIYAYRSAYSVKVAPFYYVTDRDGKILLMDKCGGVHVEPDQIATALEGARAGYARHAGSTALMETRRIQVLDSTGAPLTASEKICTLWSARHTVLYDAGLLLVHVIDTTGHVVRTWDLRRFGALTMAPLEASWAYGDSIMLGASVCLSPAGRKIFYLFNINTGELRNLNFDDSTLVPVYNVMTKPAFDPVSGRVFVGIRPRINQKLTDNAPTMIMVDTNGREIKRFGHADTAFLHHAMSDAMLTLVRSDARGTVYACESPSRALNIFDPDGNLVRTIHPDYGSYRRDFSEDMPNDPSKATMDFWMGFNSHCSHSMYIFPSSSGREIALVYMNTEYPKGVTDPVSSQAHLQLYLHRMTSEGARIGGNDIPLPLGQKPFYVEGSTVGLTAFDNDRVNLVWYKLDGGMSSQ